MNIDKTKLEESFQQILKVTKDSSKYWDNLLEEWNSKITIHEKHITSLTDKISKKKLDLKDLERTHLERKSKLENELLGIKENFERTHEKLVNKFSFEKLIKLNVGGKIFTTRLDTIVNSWCKDNFLSALFSGSFHPETDSDGNCFIDRNGDIFHHILNILRDQSYLKIIPQLPKIQKQQLDIECEFFGIELSPYANTCAKKFNSDADGDIVGKRIKIYWSSDRQWYNGRITNKLPKEPYSKKVKYVITYDDGDVRNYYLDEKKHKFIDDDE